MSIEAMKMALEALKEVNYDQAYAKEIAALRQAIEQAEKQEPFEYWSVAAGWVKIDEVREHFNAVGCGTIYKTPGENRVPLYTAPVHAVNMKQERVDETAKGGHEEKNT